MENELGRDESPIVTEKKEGTKTITLTFNTKVVAFIIVLAIVGTLLFLSKGLFIAATVNGSPISRFAVMNELESQGGAKVLETIITERLIADVMKEQDIRVSASEVDEEITLIEAQIASQGLTLADALLTEGISEDSFRKQIQTQKQIEKLLEGTVSVSDEEIETFIAENALTTPEDQVVEFRNQITEQLRIKKLNEEAGRLIETLRSEASINYYVDY